MLRIRPGLLWYLLRPLAPATVAALAVACLHVLLYRDVLAWRDGWAGTFVLVHSYVIATRFCRFGRGDFAFLYSRGFSRDLLWGHVVLASFLAALAVWLPPAVIVWAQLRSLVQDVVFLNPFFPIMAPLEMSEPWMWPIGYGVLIPLFHYEWVRRGQPARGGAAGPLLVVGVIVATAVLMSEGVRQPWFAWLCAAAGVVVVCATSVAAWLGHRDLEVRA